MRKVTMAACTCVALLAMTASTPREAAAQKQYMDAFIETYDTVAEEAKEKKCLICHGKSKKVRSDYAKELEKALGAKKVKDVDKIKSALTQVEGKEFEDGKTYGQLLKSGKLPAPAAE